MANGIFEEVSRWIMVEAKSTFENDEEALEALVQLKEADFDDLFTNRDTQLDSEEDQSIAIHFFHDEMIDSLYLHTGSDSELSIRLTLGDDRIDESNNVLNTILSYVEPLSPNDIIYHRKYGAPFESLDLPIDEESSLDIVGVRIRQDDVTYIIQEANDGEFSVMMRDDRTQEPIEGEIPDDYVSSYIENTTRLVEEEL